MNPVLVHSEVLRDADLVEIIMGGAVGNPAKPTLTTRPDYPTLNPGCRRRRLRDSHSGGVVLGRSARRRPAGEHLSVTADDAAIESLVGARLRHYRRLTAPECERALLWELA